MFGTSSSWSPPEFRKATCDIYTFCQVEDWNFYLIVSLATSWLVLCSTTKHSNELQQPRPARGNFPVPPPGTKLPKGKSKKARLFIPFILAYSLCNNFIQGRAERVDDESNGCETDDNITIRYERKNNKRKGETYSSTRVRRQIDVGELCWFIDTNCLFFKAKKKAKRNDK